MGKEKKQEKKVLYADIQVPLYKVGDDVDHCMVKNGDKVDVKATLENYANMLQHAHDYVKKICEFIPEKNDLDLYGCTHCVKLSGEPEVIERLVKFDLVALDEFANEDEDNSEEWTSDEDEEYEDEKDTNSSDDVDEFHEK